MIKKCESTASQCGNSCISSNKTCRKNAQEGAKKALSNLSEKIKATKTKEPKAKEGTAKVLEFATDNIEAKAKNAVLKDHATYEQALSDTSDRDVARAAEHKKAYPMLNDMEALSMANWNQGNTFKAFNQKILNPEINKRPLIGSLMSAIDKMPKFGEGVEAQRPIIDTSRKYKIPNNRLTRYLRLREENLKAATSESLFKGFSAFTHSDKSGERDHLFSKDAPIKIELSAKKNSGGAMLDAGKHEYAEREVLFKPGLPVNITKVTVGETEYKTFEEAKKDKNFLQGSITIYAEEL